MEYLGAWGTLIHEKKPEGENLVSDSTDQLVTIGWGVRGKESFITLSAPTSFYSRLLDRYLKTT
jgi:hypothetical protein